MIKKPDERVSIKPFIQPFKQPFEQHFKQNQFIKNKSGMSRQHQPQQQYLRDSNTINIFSARQSSIDEYIAKQEASTSSLEVSRGHSRLFIRVH